MAVAFTTPGIDRVFIACDRCGRVMPHYRVYGQKVARVTDGLCRCGGSTFRPRRLPEWRAAWWVLLVGWLWRKTIRGAAEWDPRVPLRQL
jgi:hypothetical protein